MASGPMVLRKSIMARAGIPIPTTKLNSQHTASRETIRIRIGWLRLG